MATKTKVIKIIYKKEEEIIETKIEGDDAFELLKEEIKKKFNVTTKYQLMTTNSSEHFNLLNADNFLKVVKETNGILELFMNDIEEDVQNQNNEKNNDDDKNKGNQENEDEDFIINNNPSNNDINIDNENENKEENKDENNEEKKEKQDFNIENYFQKVISDYIKNKDKDKDKHPIFDENFLFDNKQENEENELYKNNYILKSSCIKPEMFGKEKCCLCNSELRGIKHICCICDNCIMCEECELYHNHPSFKYKTKFLSNLLETSYFIETNYNFTIPAESTGYTKLFRKEYDIKIFPLSDSSFSLRPNKKYLIPIKIVNYSKDNIKSSQFGIACKNQKHIFLSPYESKEYSIDSNKEHILEIKCISPEKPCDTENIIIELFSNELNIKKSRRLSYEYKIDIGYDDEDDRLNLSFKNDENIYCFTKEHKRIALGFIKKNPSFKIKNIFRCLFENNWDENKALKALQKMG